MNEDRYAASLTKRHLIAPLIALAGWIVPGMGHLLLGRWGRATADFLRRRQDWP